MISSNTCPLVLHEVSLSDVQHDIRIFVKHGLGEIADECRDILGHESWPKNDEGDTIVQISAGLFIVAAPAVKFIRPVFGSRDPRPRLKMILDTTKGNPSSKSDNSSVFTELDALYTQILKHAMRGAQPSRS